MARSPSPQRTILPDWSPAARPARKRKLPHHLDLDHSRPPAAVPTSDATSIAAGAGGPPSSSLALLSDAAELALGNATPLTALATTAFYRRPAGPRPPLLPGSFRPDHLPSLSAAVRADWADPARPLVLGRSSRACSLPLATSRLISRQHVRLSFHPDPRGQRAAGAGIEASPGPLVGAVEIDCLGWNGAAVYQVLDHGVLSKLKVLKKGRSITLDSPGTHVLIDIHGTSVSIPWPTEPEPVPAPAPPTPPRPAAAAAAAAKTPSPLEEAAADSPLLSPSPSRLGSDWPADRARAPGSSVPSSPPPLRSSPAWAKDGGEAEPALPVPGARSRTRIQTTNWSSPGRQASTAGSSAGLFSETFIATDPIEPAAFPGSSAPSSPVRPLPPLSRPAPALSRQAQGQRPSKKAKVAEPPTHATPTPEPDGAAHQGPSVELAVACAEDDDDDEPPLSPLPETPPPEFPSEVPESPVRNHAINQLAFGPLKSVPLTTIYSALPESLRGAAPDSVGDGGAGDSAPYLSMDHFLAIVRATECLGEIERHGRDAAGRALENEYYYVPDRDQNEGRRMAVSSEGRGRTLRGVRKTHKQYFWKRPRV